MTILIASFLAGSLISLLIPVALVISLLAWHFRAFSGVASGEAAAHRPSAEAARSAHEELGLGEGSAQDTRE